MDDNNLQPDDQEQNVIKAAEADQAAAEAITRAIADSAGPNQDTESVNTQNDKTGDSLTMSRAELLDVVRRACRDAIAEVRKTDAAPFAAADDSKPRNTAVDESTPTFLSNIRPGFWDRM